MFRPRGSTQSTSVNTHPRAGHRVLREVLEVPVVRHPLAPEVHLHRRDHDPIGESGPRGARRARTASRSVAIRSRLGLPAGGDECQRLRQPPGAAERVTRRGGAGGTRAPGPRPCPSGSVRLTARTPRWRRGTAPSRRGRRGERADDGKVEARVAVRVEPLPALRRGSRDAGCGDHLVGHRPRGPRPHRPPPMLAPPRPPRRGSRSRRAGGCSGERSPRRRRGRDGRRRARPPGPKRRSRGAGR